MDPERHDPYMAEVRLYDEVADIFGHSALEDLFALEIAGIMQRGQGTINREGAMRLVCEQCDREPLEFEQRATLLGCIRVDEIASLCASGKTFDDAEAGWYQKLRETPEILAQRIEQLLDSPDS